MDIIAIGALTVAACTFLWNLFRDKSQDSDDLNVRVQKIETSIQLHSIAIERLEDEQDELKNAVKLLKENIHQLDVKIERILTILEK